MDPSTGSFSRDLGKTEGSVISFRENLNRNNIGENSKIYDFVRFVSIFSRYSFPIFIDFSDFDHRNNNKFQLFLSIASSIVCDEVF